jgi:hypothetical protein
VQAVDVGRGVGLAWRGFSIVVLTAANVVAITHSHYRAAFVGGFFISYVWWLNASRTGQGELPPRPAVWYGLGAAIGTVTGMWLMRVVYG